jgi:hypothetical protein
MFVFVTKVCSLLLVLIPTHLKVLIVLKVPEEPTATAAEFVTLRVFSEGRES